MISVLKEKFPNCLILPGFIDIHTHLRYRQEHKEDFSTGSLAAINGGLTAIADMPNTPLSPTTKGLLQKKQDRVKSSLIPIYHYASIGPITKQFQHQHYKIFTTKSAGPMFFKDYRAIEQAVSRYKKCTISFHCEDPAIIEQNKGKTNYEERRPAKAEVTAIEKIISIMKSHPTIKTNICHVSTKEGMQLIEEARSSLPITCEVTPHHLFFDVENKSVFVRGNFLTMNPPLRTQKDRLFLLSALKQNKIDFMASDHAPHLEAEKEKGIAGVPHLDTYSPFVTWLIKEQDIPIKTIENICSINPAKFLNIPHNNSFTILNLNAPLTITKENLKTKCKWSPFEEFTFPGRVEAVVINNNLHFNISHKIP